MRLNTVAEPSPVVPAPQRPTGGMMPESQFRSLDSAAIADDIVRAQRSVCYAAPGVQKEPAEAMAATNAAQADPAIDAHDGARPEAVHQQSLADHEEEQLTPRALSLG